MSELATLNLANDAPQARVEQFLRRWVQSKAPAESLPSERDLAEQLSVSRTTVRRALAALARHGLLTREGRHLRVAGTPLQEDGRLLARTIVMLMPAMQETDTQRMQWNEYLSFGSAKALRSAGLNVLSVIEKDVEDGEIQAIVRQRPMGVLIPETFRDPARTLRAARLVSQAGIPVVIYGGAPEHAVFDRVMSDHEAGSAMLTEYFIDRGFKRIVQLWPKPWEHYWFQARQRGYEKAMRQAGLEPLGNLQTGAVNPCGGNRDNFETQVRLIAGHLVPALTTLPCPEVLLCGSDRDVAYTIAACRLFGKEVGRDIQVAGYDGYLAMCEEREFEPGLPAATVSKENQRMGEQMVEVLLDRIGGKLPEGPQTRVVRPRLVISDQSVRLGER